MDDTDQDNTNPPQPTIPSLATSGEKVLQPSAESLAEIREEQANTPSPAQPKPPDSAQTQATTNTPSQQTAHSTDSIYPVATRGFGISTTEPVPVVPSTESSPVDLKIASKILAVRIVAGVILLVNAFNAYNWLLERRAGYTSSITIIEIIIVLVLAIGIFKLSEAARIAYVFISVALLILSVVGLINFYSSAPRTVIADSPSDAQLKSVLEKSLAEDNKSKSLSSEQKQRLDQSLQQEITSLSGSPDTLKVKQYVSEGLLLLVAIGPLIFFTRPSIKAVFN